MNKADDSRAAAKQLRKNIETAHELDGKIGKDDSHGLAAERALVEHWLNEGKATLIIAAMDYYSRQIANE